MCQNIISAIQPGSYCHAGAGGDWGRKLWKGLAASLHSSGHQPRAGDTADQSSALKQGKREKPQPWTTTTQHLPPILLLEGPKDFCNGSAKHKRTRISPSSHQHPWEHPLCAHRRASHPCLLGKGRSTTVSKALQVCFILRFPPAQAVPVPWQRGGSKAVSPMVCTVPSRTQDATLRPWQLCSPLPCLLSHPPSSNIFLLLILKAQHEIQRKVARCNSLVHL